ncbi:glycosyltransferase family 4 protein [Porticoccaceae bacterium]|nr:glycosyltransferase family 4 protein [Porticoccaceae bacterium]
MNVVVNCQLLTPNSLRGMGTYKFEILNKLLDIDTGNNYFLVTNTKQSFDFLLQSFGAKDNCRIDLCEIGIVFFEQFYIPFYCIRRSASYFINSGDTSSILTCLIKVDSILVLHDVYFCKPTRGQVSFRKWLAKIYRRLTIKYSIRRAYKIFTVSEFAKSDIIFEFGAYLKSKIVVTYNGLGTAGESGQNLRKYNRLLLVSGSDPQKNVKWFLNCLISHAKFLDELELVQVVGVDGYQDIDFISHPKVEYVGFVRREALDDFYRESKYFAIPSLLESFGMPGIEALSYGCVVLSSNTGAMPEVLGDRAFYFSPTSPSELNDCLNDVMMQNFPTEVTTTQDGLSKFSWQTASQSFLDILVVKD